MTPQEQAAELAHLGERISTIAARMEASATEAARVWGTLADGLANHARTRFQRQAVARIVRKYL